MVRTKQIPRKEDKKKIDKEDFVKEPSKWGDASKVGFHRIFKIHVL